MKASAGAAAYGALIAAGLSALSAPVSAAELLGESAKTFELVPIATGLEQPTDVAALADGTLLISERHGRLVVVEPDGTVADVANSIPVNAMKDEQGLLGVVVDDDFDRSRTVFVYASIGPSEPDRHKVLRSTFNADWELSGLTPIIDKGLLGFANHAGGGLVIHEHQLYVSVGDAGGNNTVPPSNQLGTCLNSPNGKILRVNLDGSIPSDNPLVGMEAVTGCAGISKPMGSFPPDERVYAWGLRNPFRFAIDATTGLLWVADVGDRAREELSIGGKGSHFGWPFYEGTVHYEPAGQPFQPQGACLGIEPSRPCVPPVYEYTHVSKRNAIIGGPILDVCEFPPIWRSRYLFGDNGSGELWTLDVAANRTSVVADSLRPFAKLLGPASLRIGADRSLYLVDVAAGEVYRVQPRVRLTGACQTEDFGSAGAGTGGAAAIPTVGGASASGENEGGQATRPEEGASPSGVSDDASAGDTGGEGKQDRDPGSANASGCGCQTAGPNGVWAWLLASTLVIAARYRRGARSAR